MRRRRPPRRYRWRSARATLPCAPNASAATATSSGASDASRIATRCSAAGTPRTRRITWARAASPAEAKSSRRRPRGSGTGPGRSAVGLQVAGLEALLEPVEGAHARPREVSLAAAIDKHAAVESVDNAYQLGLEAVLVRLATRSRCEVLL